MRVGRVGTALAIIVLAVFAFPALAHAALAITVPLPVNLGSVPSGSTSASGQLGTVTVTASGLVLPSFTATVSATDFATGAGGAGLRIGKASISYWSGPATAALLQDPNPGQATAAQAQDLSVSRRAFSSDGLALSIVTSWNPTIVVTIPTAAVAGTYSGTITHSVA